MVSSEDKAIHVQTSDSYHANTVLNMNSYKSYIIGPHPSTTTTTKWQAIVPLLVDGSAGSASAGAGMSPPSTSDSDAELLPPISRSDKFRSLPLSCDESANNCITWDILYTSVRFLSERRATSPLVDEAMLTDLTHDLFVYIPLHPGHTEHVLEPIPPQHNNVPYPLIPGDRSGSQGQATQCSV